jgi:hypothetical protein
MKTVRACVVIAVCLFLISALPGFAQRRLPRMDPYYDYDLELTSEQIQQIEEMELKFQQEILPLESDLDMQYLEMRRMIAQNEEQAKIDAKLDRIDKMEIEIDQKYQAHQTRIRDLLTDRQKMLFDEQGGLGMGLGWDYRRGYAPGYGRGYGRGYGGGYAPGYGRGLGRGYGLGYGRGYGPGYGRWYGPGYERGYGLGYGRGYGLGYGRGYAPGYGKDYRIPYNRGYGLGYGRGLGRGWGRGFGRGYWCPWRWR